MMPDRILYISILNILIILMYLLYSSKLAFRTYQINNRRCKTFHVFNQYQSWFDLQSHFWYGKWFLGSTSTSSKSQINSIQFHDFFPSGSINLKKLVEEKSLSKSYEIERIHTLNWHFFHGGCFRAFFKGFDGNFWALEHPP